MCTYSGCADNCYRLIQRQWVRVRVSGDLLVREPCRHRTADLSKVKLCAKPPHCRAVGLVSLLRKECCQPFVKSSGCLAHSTTCCKYQWSERGPFDFSDTLFIGVMTVNWWDQLVGVLGLKTLTSKMPVQPTSPETSCTNVQPGILSTNSFSHRQYFSCERLQGWLHSDVATYLFQ